jgi:hypothetical protein
MWWVFGWQDAPAGAVWGIEINGTDYQALKLDDGTYAAMEPLGDWAVTGLRDELAAMAAIIDRIEAHQGPSVGL